MIIPDKTITLKYSLIGTGSKILTELNIPQTISSLWERVRTYEEINTFGKFVLTLDFLYMLRVVVFDDGVIKKARK
jgi:hypothetical protein